MMKKVPVFSNRLIFAAAAACVSQWLTAGVPGGVPGIPGGVPGIPGGVPGIPGGVPGIPGGVPGIPGGGGIGLPVSGQNGTGQVSLTPPVQQRPGWTPAMGPMRPDLALSLLIGNGFTAKAYYNGVPDLSGRGAKKIRSRDMIKGKLRNLIIPKVEPLHDLTMKEAMVRLDTLFRESDPSKVGFNLAVNPFIDPGGAAVAPTNPNNGGGAAGPAGGMTIDPVTGLPIGGAPAGGGASPQIDPVTGLPVSAPGGGAPGLPGGVPGALGGLPGMGGGLPGMGGGLPGMGGGAPSSAMQGAFDPDQVKVNGLNSPMFNMTAKQILDVVAMSFDHPIQYVVLDQGIMFFQQDPKFAGTVTQTFRLNLNSRSLAQLGIQTPQLGQGGGGQNGGQGNGANQPGGGAGGYPGGQGAGGGYPGGAPGAGGGGPGPGGMTVPKYSTRNTFRPFNSMGGYRFNSITPGYGPSRVRGRQ